MPLSCHSPVDSRLFRRATKNQTGSGALAGLAVAYGAVGSSDIDGHMQASVSLLRTYAMILFWSTKGQLHQHDETRQGVEGSQNSAAYALPAHPHRSYTSRIWRDEWRHGGPVAQATLFPPVRLFNNPPSLQASSIWPPVWVKTSLCARYKLRMSAAEQRYCPSTYCSCCSYLAVRTLVVLVRAWPQSRSKGRRPR
ncbi:hypothetical protein BDW62DRAFT_11988 [Aspergillus aurantiobrunneus]